MNSKNVLLFDDEDEFINEKNKIQDINSGIYLNLFLSNKANFLSFNELNHQIYENITLVHLKNIMNSPQIEEEQKDMMDQVYYIKEQNNSKIELKSTDNTDNTTKTVSISENENSIKKEDIFYKKINFKTILYRKRGRKENEKKLNKKSHGSSDFDNIQRKIQVHFITFLIQFANDIVKSILGNKKNYHFMDIKYNIKKIVNHGYIESLKKLNYSDILQKPISRKNKKFDENSNKKLYEKLIEESEIIRKIFDKKYLYIFQKYYFCLKDNEIETDFDGIKIKLSNKTRPFTHLLRKNENEKDKFKNVVQDVYFSDINYLIGKKFVTKNFV
jgi:hypothetical protein